MKTPTSLLLLAAAIIPAAFLQVGCSKNDSVASQAEQGVKTAAASATAAVSDSWDSVKDFTYERRVEFTDGFNRMTARMDDQTRDLKARGGKLTDAAAKDRDDSMNSLAEARASLKASLTDLGNATADTWADAKEKVRQSWVKVTAAFDKATSSAAPAVAANP